MKKNDPSLAEHAGWQHYGAQRPAFAEKPGPGQESVWDFPRPPVARSDSRLVEVRLGDVEIARSRQTVRVLETASPPTFYLPPQDVAIELLHAAPGQSHCEWKGRARYFDIATEHASSPQAAWSYDAPLPEFVMLRGFIAFYPDRVACYVDGQRVRPQPGHFYGGWVTDDVVGPFKGESGTAGW